MRLLGICGGLLLIVCRTSSAEDGVIRFEDVTSATRLATHLESTPAARPWRYAHGAAWGDINNDGRPDLYAGAFAARKWFTGSEAPQPNWLFLNRGATFESVNESDVQFRDGTSRCAGSLFADLDQDGDLDLIVANHVMRAEQGGSRLFENLGDSKFRDVTPNAAPWTSGLGMRNVAVIDLDDDGRLDLILADGSYGKNANARAKLIALQNEGAWRFRDVTSKIGLPAGDTLGLGLAVGDVNDDGKLDVFVAGCNRLFVSTEAARFREAMPGKLSMPAADVSEGSHCGAAFGDLDGDGDLDLVTTEHGVPARIHVFQNRGVKNAEPDLIEVSQEIGLGELFPKGTRELPIKTAHVSLQDFDNDGRIDLLLTVIAKSADGVLQPVVLKNLSSRPGELRFQPLPFDRMTTYYAPGPVADFDRDGRLDIFLPSWFENVPNALFRNVTEGGHWLTVRVVGQSPKRNSMGVGATVRIFAAGHLGDDPHRMGRADISIGNGYASGEEALAHFGLGKQTTCDVLVSWGQQHVERKNVSIGKLLTIEVP